ncbi:hypothetical protein SAMN05216223_101692 [Actinacidiphila yanglinensis]|uniref:LmbU n=1 Tax=Actinacidiphila yanglinensis TaxID=310779 RepID=A0A1H5TXV9_9ACTN|nr:LmbU family transcriptional regulator [Actinacidiphila yanglinensis]SEF67665.1 hypothetical protein SAMN05216223_101692 [Actinacidiphila yanglinensis]
MPATRTARLPRAAGPDERSGPDTCGYCGDIDPRAAVERTGLSLPDDLTLNDWCRIGDRLLAVSDASCWWVGDWLVFGCEKYPDRYKRAIAGTSLDYQTLRNYAWVARAFPPSRRRDTLTFQHHMEVTKLRPAEQDHWLDFAVRLKWSRNELRRQLRASAETSGGEEQDAGISLQLDLSRERYLRWERAAQLDHAELQDWIVEVLDGVVCAAREAPRLPSGEQPAERI